MKTKDSSGKKKILNFFKYDSWKTRLERGLCFKVNFNSYAVDGKSRVKYIKENRVKKNAFLSIFFYIYQNYIKQSATQCFFVRNELRTRKRFRFCAPHSET